MTHLRRLVSVAAALVVAGLPAFFQNATVKHVVETHPVLAAYFPVASGLAYALLRAVQTRGSVPAGPPAGSSTMKAVG
jgi:hypothetical protein